MRLARAKQAFKTLLEQRVSPSASPCDGRHTPVCRPPVHYQAMAGEKVLIVDDERLVRWSLRQKCEEWGYQVSEADTADAALALARPESPDLVLLDVRLPDANGLQVLEELKKNQDARAVILISAAPRWDAIKVAVKLGAYDVGGKPLHFDELLVAMKNALEASRLRRELQTLRAEVRRRTAYNSFIGTSAKMTELMGFVR